MKVLLTIILGLTLFLAKSGAQGSQNMEVSVSQQGGLRQLKQGSKIKNPCINLSGYEYPDKSVFPTKDEIDYYFSKGLKTIRLPIRWERLQPTLNGPFDNDFFSGYASLCDYAVSKGGYCIIDVHNYGYYNGNPIGGATSVDSFKDLWTRLANHDSFKNNDNVWFTLMNEPNGFDTYVVKNFMQAGIDAVRATGANNWVIFNGNGYSGAYSWVNNAWYGTPNGQVFVGLQDPLKKLIVDAHNYLDADNSGTSENCADTNLGVSRLYDFIPWAKQNGYKIMIGETGAGQSSSCLQGVDTMLNYLEQNSDSVWSWCWWAGGKVWDPSYVSLLDPVDGQDQPQMSVIQKYV